MRSRRPWRAHRRARRLLASTLLVALATASLSSASAPAPSAAAAGYSESQVKAALIYNVAKMTRWPRDEAGHPASFVIGILRDERFAAVMSETIGEHEIQNAPVVIRCADSLEDLADARIVVVESSSVAETLEALGDRPVLTVGDGELFCRAGGMLGLVRVGGRLRIAVNREEAARCGIVFSSQLLKLARLVSTDSGS